jgi:hypothetical protein
MRAPRNTPENYPREGLGWEIFSGGNWQFLGYPSGPSQAEDLIRLHLDPALTRDQLKSTRPRWGSPWTLFSRPRTNEDFVQIRQVWHAWRKGVEAREEAARALQQQQQQRPHQQPPALITSTTAPNAGPAVVAASLPPILAAPFAPPIQQQYQSTGYAAFPPQYQSTGYGPLLPQQPLQPSFSGQYTGYTPGPPQPQPSQAPQQLPQPPQAPVSSVEDLEKADYEELFGQHR